jgi:phosphoribosyl-AMP cyclohydrolase
VPEVTERLSPRFDEHGLMAAVVQDDATDEVLMVGWMNEEALRKTLETGRTCFYSRSRGKLWVKGEESGHVQRVKSVRVDCDQDALLVRVSQTGGACHEGYHSCFFRQIDGKGELRVMAERVFDPKSVYRKK